MDEVDIKRDLAPFASIKEVFTFVNVNRYLHALLVHRYKRDTCRGWEEMVMDEIIMKNGNR